MTAPEMRPDSSARSENDTRRSFLSRAAAGTAAAGLAVASPAIASAALRDNSTDSTPEGLVRRLHESLTDAQKSKMCFAWDHTTKEHGLLRMHVSNNWQINEQRIGSNFYTADQQDMIEALFWGLYSPEWKPKIQKQLKDDAGGYGKAQSIAIFGDPENGPFELVMTGRHLTIRCDGNSVPHTAFGGPIFYGHAAQGFNEAPDHPGNVFWSQALKANELYGMLDGTQRKSALLPAAPMEEEVHFRKEGGYPGLAVAEMSSDQQEHLQGVLTHLLEPYRQTDRDEVLQCLKSQGGLQKCALSFYEREDVGGDKVWDNWRLEGPSFVWYYRGDPHVHCWVNIADNPSVQITTAG